MSDPIHLLNPAASWSGLPAVARARVRFASTWRGEPVLQGSYACNYGLHVGDVPETVMARRLALAAHHGISPVWMKQIHGTQCARLNATHASNPPEDAVVADAAYTTEPGVAAVIMTADCLPVLLTDHRGRAVAAAHCGWRGLLDGILEQVLSAFAADGLLDGPLHAWLGPCIGPESFEVGAEVYDAYCRADPLHAVAFKSLDGSANKWMADLQVLAVQRLQRHAEVVVDRDLRDTFRHPNLNSFRRNRITGRQASLIWLDTGH